MHYFGIKCTCSGPVAFSLDNRPSWRRDDDVTVMEKLKQTLVSEVLLKAGEVLYVPTQWFHYISNIGINAQCNRCVRPYVREKGFSSTCRALLLICWTLQYVNTLPINTSP